jgi:MFS family permease
MHSDRLAGGGVVLAASLPVVATFGLSSAPVVLDEAQQAFGATPGTASWILVGYMLAMGVANPAMGKLADVRGTRCVLLVGAALLLAGSLCCLLAGSIAVVIAGRMIQGVGAAGASNAGLALLSAHGGTQARVRRLGWLTAGSSVVLGVGAFVGALVGRLGWRWVLVLPLCAGLLAAPTAAYPGVRGEPARPFDLPGALLAMCSAAALLLAIQGLGDRAPLALVLGAAMAALATGRLLIAHTHRRPDGFVPLGVLRHPWLRRTFVAAGALSGWSLGTMALGPLLIAEARPGWSATEVGVALLPVALVAAGVSLAAVRWPPTQPIEPALVLIGVVGVVAGLGAALLAGPAGPVVAMASGTSAFAVAQVIVLGRLPDLVPQSEVGVAIGTLSLTFILGGALGTSMAVGAFALVPGPGAVALLTAVPLSAVVALTHRRRREA